MCCSDSHSPTYLAQIKELILARVIMAYNPDLARFLDEDELAERLRQNRTSRATYNGMKINATTPSYRGSPHEVTKAHLDSQRLSKLEAFEIECGWTGSLEELRGYSESTSRERISSIKRELRKLLDQLNKLVSHLARIQWALGEKGLEAVVVRIEETECFISRERELRRRLRSLIFEYSILELSFDSCESF